MAKTTRTTTAAGGLSVGDEAGKQRAHNKMIEEIIYVTSILNKVPCGPNQKGDVLRREGNIVHAEFNPDS